MTKILFKNNSFLLFKWLLSSAFVLYVILNAFFDPNMAVEGSLYLTTESSANLILYISYFMSIIVIITAFCDWQITRINRRIQLINRFVL